jgi:hypothetical protein
MIPGPHRTKGGSFTRTCAVSTRAAMVSTGSSTCLISVARAGGSF